MASRSPSSGRWRSCSVASLADEIVACLAEANRIDPTHIHSMGMSAGGLQTTAISFVRSAYIASVATFFEANAFGAWPSPYVAGLPATFPTYCAR